MSLEKLDVASLKKSGYMKQKQIDLFVVRLRMPCGNLTSEQLSGISELAKKYGTGNVHITTRQGIQIPNINIHDLDAITKELEDNGTPPGSCGPRVRNIIACPGNSECNYGIIDTYEMGGSLDKEFFGEDMPVKIKFAVTGCPNACAKPQENDLGLMGILKPLINTDECTGCGTCTFMCPEKAIVIEDDRATILWDKCNLCGACVGTCPSDLIGEEWKGYKIFAGGKIGKHPKLGKELTDAKSEKEAFAIFRKIINWSKKNTKTGERFGDCLDRVGFEKFKKEILKQG
ncbi:MAG: 4Fe-4S binding protein [Candidatus Methanoperedens sp.]|nr:4Fe-4S binding protein [Candidatus Methanoperedens sp.]MCE8426472.1 4Fe-4S binding protein [Candidatus Methanoperedens sp.]MCE8428044.1 4Fe-4S binding protein [Candidatus Methanoperedens sp.]